jgi:nickel-dependent lactate racemase
MKIDLPYDKKRIRVEIDDRNFAGSLISRVESYQPGASQQELVEASLDHTIDSPRLEELVKGKKTIVIIDSDHTRPVPSGIITRSCCGGSVRRNRTRTSRSWWRPDFIARPRGRN